MSSGIYAYWDNVKNCYVYVGKDSHIDKKTRHNDHIAESKNDEQPINRVLQNNPERYEYRVIMKGDYNDWQLNQMEKLCIKSFKTHRYDYPDRNVFNFTPGGDGFGSGESHPNYLTNLNDDEIIELYKNEKLSTHEIADKLNVNRSTILRRLRKNNIICEKRKYTLWNINVISYNKRDMFKNNGGDRPKKVFRLKYNGKRINIGGFIDFTTPEIIHDLICEAIGDYNE